MKSLLLLIGMLIFINCSGQKQDNIWYFGTHAGLNFNSGSPRQLENGMLDTYDGSACISTEEGRLLFYTDGVTVYDSTHNVMMNGNDLGGSTNSTQSALIIPVPGSSHNFLIFTTDYAYSDGRFAYSMVDMSQNNGLGKVVSKNNLVQNNCAEEVTAVMHANSQDFWIIVHQRADNIFRSYLVNSSGFNINAIISSTGPVITGLQGYLKASPNGTMLAMATYLQKRVEMYSFNNSTGSITYNIGFSYQDATLGVEFSGDNSKLYVSVSYNLRQIYQINIASNTNQLIATTAMLPGALQSGPDGKIYVSHYNRPNIGSSYLGVINFPELYGTACNYVDQAIFLGSGLSKAGLPNFFHINSCSAMANFLHQSNCKNQPVQFTDLSSTPTGFITQWIWSFGDGSPDDTINFPENPNIQHIFSNSGTINVTLLIRTSLGCSSSVTQSLIISPSPSANFYYSSNCQNQLVQFTDASLTNGVGIVGWQWDFGDPASGVNNTSNLSDPTHSYSYPGSFNVTLIVTNLADCMDTIIKQVISNQSSQIEFNYTAACTKQIIYFNPDTTVINVSSITSWSWNFGDGATSSLPNPTHIYNQSGIYSVTLSVIDTANCTNSIAHQVTIVAPPVALFSVISPSCSNSQVQFNDNTSYGLGQTINWHWDFGDGQTSSDQNPIHSYDLEGDYLVCLTVQNECGQDLYCDLIAIIPEPISNFTFIQQEDLVVAFSNQSLNADSFLWDFGDGQVSNEPNPIHTYNYPGNYQVCLSVTNECSSASECDTVIVIGNVGLNLVKGIESVEIYPNPARDEVLIKANSKIIYQIDIIDSKGNLCDRILTEYYQNKYRISLQDKASGLYLIRFLTDKGIMTRRLIIQ